MIKQKFKLGKLLLQNLLILSGKKYQSPGNGKNVYVDLQEGRMIPSYFYVLYAFHEQGYRVQMKFRLKFLAGFFGPNKAVLKMPGLLFYRKDPKTKQALIITDRPTAVKNAKMVVLNPLAFDRTRLNDREHIFLPYLMHPDVYISRDFEKVEQLRKARKKMRIFYSGNSIKEAYDNPEIPEKFGMLNRYEIIDYVQKNLKEEELLAVSDKTDWDNLNGGFCNKLVMIRWEWSPVVSNNLEVRIKKQDWLPTLAAAQFFLACPGISVPYSHNAIEAMSVGTIPVLSYSDYFHPKLVHGKNCICFRDQEDLLIQIRQVLKMPEDQIKQMSENVIKYYEENLTLNSVIRQIEQAAVSKNKEVYYFNEVLY